MKMYVLGLGLFLSVVFSAPWASAVVRSDIPDSYDDFEGIELAVKLAEDGKFKLAEKVLAASQSLNNNLDRKSRANRERVLGLLLEESASGKPDLERASQHFAAALKIVESLEFHIDKQRVDFAREDYASCTESVRRSKAQLSSSSASRIRIASKCLRKSKRAPEALDLINLALKNQPVLKINPVIASEKVEILIDLGFNEVALEVAIATMKSMANVGQLGVSSFALDLVDLLKDRSSFLETRFSEKVLEAAQVYSANEEKEDVVAARAKLSYSKGKSLTSAMSFENLLAHKADQKSQIYVAAIELYRLSGWRSLASNLVPYIDDPKDRLRARVSGFFERNEMAKVAAVYPSLDRHLLDEEEWIYLGAFARLQSGGWEEVGTNAPVRWLAKLKRPENREKAAVLRQLVSDCQTGLNQPCSL